MSSIFTEGSIFDDSVEDIRDHDSGPRPDNVGGNDFDIQDALVGGAEVKAPACGCPNKAPNAALDPVLSDLELGPGECSEDPNRPAGAPCSSKIVVATIAKFAAGAHPVTAPATSALPTAQTGDAKAVRAAAAATKCDSESCVISHPKFVAFASAAGIAPEVLQVEKERAFKTAGPRNSTELLNNFHIDETLQRWARVFPEFFPYPFAMMDFDKTGEPLARLDIVDVLQGSIPHGLGPGWRPVRTPARCAACILNTDTSTGPGKHWVALFVDARPGPGEDWTIEYFNSAGRPPPKPVVAWMEKTRARLLEYRKKRGDTGSVETIAVTAVAHQDSQTECGVYGLFYIRKRLEGTSYTFFQDPKRLVSDEAMTQFRQFIFRAHA